MQTISMGNHFVGSYARPYTPICVSTAGSAGTVTTETIKRYIEEQKGI